MSATETQYVTDGIDVWALTRASDAVREAFDLPAGAMVGAPRGGIDGDTMGGEPLTDLRGMRGATPEQVRAAASHARSHRFPAAELRALGLGEGA